MLPADATRVAVISLHTSPLDQPGVADSGGMNVYIREVMERLGDRGVAVDVFTRCAGRRVPEVEPIGDLARVIQVRAGPCAPVAKEALPAVQPDFVRSVIDRAEADGGPYDLVHAHYWLSGWTGLVAKWRWRIPLVASFHTLGRVKNLSMGYGDAPEPADRLRGEQSAIRDADRILAPTPIEANHLVDLYGARDDRIRLVSPGVDGVRFGPRPAAEAKAALGLSGRPVVLFVGRLQPHKGPDVAIRAVAEAVRRAPAVARDMALLVVGGPSGRGQEEVGRLRRLASEAGIAERVRFHAPVPHEDLPRIYAAADVVLLPSRSESFGLVALEAQACGVPVVAAAVGGLRFVVDDGRSGLLVEGRDPADYAREIVRILSDGRLAGRLSRGSVRQAARFPWEGTADGVLGVYRELIPDLGLESGEGVAAAP